jgi:hypothetical protein
MIDGGLVESVHRFGEGVVVTVADASDGNLDSILWQSLGTANGHILNVAIRVMHEAASLRRRPIMKCLLQFIEDKASMCCTPRPPSHDAASEDFEALPLQLPPSLRTP